MSFLNQISKLFKKPAQESDPQSSLQKDPVREKTVPATDQTERAKEGYLELVELCNITYNKNELVGFINGLTMEDDFLDEIMSFSWDQNIHFITLLDWKERVIEFEEWLEAVLIDNFETTLKLPDSKKYGENASVSFKNVFKDYDGHLRSGGYKLGFIDTGGDCYVLFVFRLKYEVQVRKAVEKINYPYHDVNSFQIE